MFKGPTECNMVVSERSKFEGVLNCVGSSRIKGNVIGQITSDDLVIIDTTAEIKADIDAREVHVIGKVVGSIRAAEKVVLQTNGHVEGAINTPNLIMEPGCSFKGDVNMGKNDDLNKNVNEEIISDEKGDIAAIRLAK